MDVQKEHEVTTTRARRDPEGRRRAIIDATVQLITELGINDVNHRRIAARAGVPLGATTQYFASREDLLNAALQQMEAECERDLDRLADDLATSADPVVTVAEFFHQYLREDAQSQAALAFFLVALQARQLTELTDRWDERQREVLQRHFDRRFADAAATHAYGLYVQVSCTRQVPTLDDTVWVLRRFLEA